MQATVEAENSARPFTLGEEDDMQEQNELSLKTGAKKCEKEWALDINHVEEVKILKDVARSRFRFITRFEGEKLEEISLNRNKTEHMIVCGSLWQSLVSSSKSCMICTQCRGHCGAGSGQGSKLNKFMWAVEF